MIRIFTANNSFPRKMGVFTRVTLAENKSAVVDANFNTLERLILTCKLEILRLKTLFTFLIS